MTPFPLVNGRVQMTTSAVGVTDSYLSALRISTAPAVRASTAAAQATCGGLAFTATGQLVYVDATAGLPANTQFCNGRPVTPSGALCVSTGAVASWSGGLPFAANGAVCVTLV